MRILQTPPRYAPNIGGVEAVAKAVSEGLRAQGDEVLVVCADEPAGSPPEVNGIPVKRLRSQFKIANTNIAAGLPRALMRADYDLIHTHLPSPWWADWSCLIGRIRRKRVVLSLHNVMVGEGLNRPIAWLYRKTIQRLTFRLAHRILVQSEPWRDHMVTAFPRLESKIVVVPYGVDMDVYAPPREGTQLSQNLIFVSILDQFHEYKGLTVLLNALALDPCAPLRVVGEGPLKHSYQRLARELGIDHIVEFCGALSDEELLIAYQRAAGLVLPNFRLQEGGSSLVVLEAMACGLPVIVADGAGAIPWQAEATPAITRVPANDPAALSKAIRAIMLDPERRAQMGATAREYVVANNSWSAIVKQIRKIYEEIDVR